MSKYIKTNIGDVPLEDFLEIQAVQYGFDSYEDMQSEGLSVSINDEDIIEYDDTETE